MTEINPHELAMSLVYNHAPMFPPEAGRGYGGLITAITAALALARSQGRADGRAAVAEEIRTLATEVFAAPVAGLTLDGEPMCALFGGGDVAFRLGKFADEVAR